MSRLTLFFLSLISVVLLSSFAFAAGPKLEVTPEVWDLGTVNAWDEPAAEVTLKNSGDQPLVIEDVKTSCGCTAAVVSEKTIKPGESGKLRMTYDPFNTNPGPIRKDVLIMTNDPASPKKRVPLKGRVSAEKAAIGSLAPDYVDIGVTAPYETKYFLVNIKNRGNIDLNLGTMDLPKGCFLDTGKPSKAAPRGSASIRVGYRPTKSSGPIDEQLTVNLEGPGQKPLKLRLVGYVAEQVRGSDALIITPSALKVSPDAPNPVVGVSLKNEGTGRVLVDGAESSLESGEAGITSQELKAGESGRVSLPIKPEGLKPDTKGYLYIRVAIPIIVDTEKK